MYIECPDIAENRFTSIYTNFNDETYRLTFKWNEYCNCCFLSIYDGLGQPILTGNALVAGTAILTDLRKLPALILFHKDGKPGEPTIETLKDYVLYYDENITAK